MTKSVLKCCVSAAAVAVFSLTAASAMAQAPAAAPANGGDGDTLSEIVVTASTGDKSKLNTSASISSVAADEIQKFNATSTAELYRLIPGIQVAGTQGDGGNSNIGVRGLRTPTGGSPFVQVQEDGLPTVLFGDIQFGNNDYWTHPDPQTQRVEAIRGGTASTLASQAIGAVLNHISFTGKNDGGYIEIEKGVNYDWTKVNARLSGSINDSTYYNLGGYFDIGRGIEHAAYNVHNSYLIKGNVTKEFADGKGWIRLLFKVSDTQEPSYNGCISNGTVSNKKVTGIGPSSFCDLRNQAPGYSALNSSVLFLNADVTTLQQQNLNGISTRQKYLQAQAHYDFNDNLKLDDNFRVARMNGTFAVQFYGADPTANVAGPGRSLIYSNGPNAGKVFTGAYVANSVSVHTNMTHMDHVANDLSLSYKGDTGGAGFDFKLGWFYFSQRIAENWHSNGSLNEVNGVNPAELDLVSGLNGTGNLLSVGGQTSFNQGWNQQFDTTFTNNAPYANLSVDIGDLNIDGSIREEIFRGSGWAQGSSGNVVGNTAVVTTDPRTGARVTVQVPTYGYDGARENINFHESATNWSAGLLYKVTPSLSIFGRASHGTRFIADRLTRSSPTWFAADGSLNAAGLASARAPVTQYELGLKTRGDLAGGHYTVELTGFYSKYSISSQEISQTNCKNILGIDAQTCVISGLYKDYGVELFSTYKNGGLNLVLSATYDNSKVAANQKAAYLRSPNIPRLTYTGLVSYDIADKGEIGISFNGQSATPGGDGNSYPGSVLFGAFAKFKPVEHIEVGISAYNLFNTFALQGAGGVIDATHIGAGGAQGRAVKASVKFDF